MHSSSLILVQASIFILLVFVHHAVQFNTHDIQKFICTAGVEIDEDRNTLVKLHKSGSSCQYLPLIVDRNGFNFDIVFPSDAAQGELGFFDFLFADSTARVDLRFKKQINQIIVYSGDHMITSLFSTTATIKVSADGTSSISHGNEAGFILFPSLTHLPSFATDKAVLKVKFIWRNLIDGLNVRFPPEIGFLYATTTTTTTDAVTQSVITPTTSPSNNDRNTASVGPITEVAASIDHTPKSAKENQQFKHIRRARMSIFLTSTIFVEKSDI